MTMSYQFTEIFFAVNWKITREIQQTLQSAVHCNKNINEKNIKLFLIFIWKL